MAETRILVVEDEPSIRDLIAFGLRRAGFQVVVAEHSQAALASLGDRRPDLMLVDWMLPDMSGLELTAAAAPRRQHPRHPDHHADGTRRGD